MVSEPERVWTLFQAAECPVDLSPMYLLRDARTAAWFFYAPCCGIAFQWPPNGRVDEIVSLQQMGIERVRLPTRAEIQSGPWAALALVEETRRDLIFANDELSREQVDDLL